MNNHGVKQSQEYTKAVHALAEAKKNLLALADDDEATEKHRQDAEDRLIAAYAARDAAYKAYTNPFNSQKTTV